MENKDAKQWKLWKVSYFSFSFFKLPLLPTAALLPCWHRDLGQSPQHDGLLQTHKRHEGILQEVDLPDQHVGRFGVSRQLFHELVLQLSDRPAGSRW